MEEIFVTQIAESRQYSGTLHVREVEGIGICELNNRFHVVRNGL